MIVLLRILVTVPLNFKYNSIGSLVTSILNKTITKDYEVSGDAQLGIFNIPFSKKGIVELK